MGRGQEGKVCVAWTGHESTMSKHNFLSILFNWDGAGVIIPGLGQAAE